MKLKYDLHIHTALSPCADEDNTPNNILNMSLINELDIIAITDHNTCENVWAVIEVAKDKDIIVIPGMEIETKEEIHAVCLFSDLNDVYNVQEIIFKNLPNLANREEIFGKQTLLNGKDESIGQLDRLLMFATNLSIDDLVYQVSEHNGIVIPAHIDRPSYSVISNLGMIPTNLKLSTLEISRFAKYDEYARQYETYQIIQNSDAHELGYIGICNQSIEVKEKSIEAIMEKLKFIK